MSDFIELKNQLSELHDTIAALTAERDEWKAIAQSYDGCLEGIALKLERKKVAELVPENRAYDLRMENDAKRIAELEGELGRWKQIVIYDCEDDTDIRELAKPFTDTEGDSYGVPTPPDIVEQLCKQLTTANATLDKLRETAPRGYLWRLRTITRKR